jgi:hypothetical protein
VAKFPLDTHQPEFRCGEELSETPELNKILISISEKKKIYFFSSQKMNNLLKHRDLNLIYVKETDDKTLDAEASIIGRVFGIDKETHIRTSCWATASMIRWMVSDDPQEEWKQVDTPTQELYQVGFGEDIENIDHYLTVHNNDVYQSYWRKSTIYKISLLESSPKELLDSMPSEEAWNTLTGGIDDIPDGEIQCFYYETQNWRLDNIYKRIPTINLSPLFFPS